MYKIFIIEDDPTIAQTLKKHLEGWDYKVECAKDFHNITAEFAAFDPQLVLLENYGYTVIDLGKDVEYQAVVDAAKKHNVKLVGLSALMTTTLKSMEETIKLIRESGLDCKVVVGGAVLTPEYAEKIGADFYAKDAKETVDIAKQVIG